MWVEVWGSALVGPKELRLVAVTARLMVGRMAAMTAEMMVVMTDGKPAEWSVDWWVVSWDCEKVVELVETTGVTKVAKMVEQRVGEKDAS